MRARLQLSFAALFVFLTLALGSVDGEGPDQAPSGSAAPAGFGGGLAGAYVGLERGLGASAPGQATLADALEVDVFFPDGTYRRRLPLRGLASDLAWDATHQPSMWGAWHRDGDQVVARRGAYSTAYTVAGEGVLTSERGRSWVKLAPHSDTRLSGTYARADYRDGTAPRLVLDVDGSYHDRGDFLHMIGSASNLVVPDGDVWVTRWTDAEARGAMAAGSGTYTFSDFTLTLRGSDGRVWQFNAYLPPGESTASPATLVVNGRQLQRD